MTLPTRIPPHCDCGILGQLGDWLEPCDWAALAAPKPVQFQHGRQDAAFCPDADPAGLKPEWNTAVMPGAEFAAAFAEVGAGLAPGGRRRRRLPAHSRGRAPGGCQGGADISYGELRMNTTGQEFLKRFHRALLLASVLLTAAGCRTAVTTDQAPSAVAPVRLSQQPRTDREMALPLTVWTERREQPEPLAIHVLRVDLQSPALDVIAMPADDPDGDGPSEAALIDPRELITQFNALAGVNANAFGALPEADGKTSSRWREGQPVEIEGVAVHAGVVRSGPAKHAANNLCFWLDAARQPHFGPWPGDATDVREAVNAWWGHLLDGGKVLPQPGGDRHPRTAVGVDASGRWLYLVVVDGRQPGYSVGMTTYELASMMAQLGCDRAINLDGGGSSILLAADAAGTLAIVNRPSGGAPRPIPLMLGVRQSSFLKGERPRE